MRRAIRILRLENVTVERGDIEAMNPGTMCLVSRATMPPQRIDSLRRLLLPGGLAVVGGSWVAPPEVPEWETVAVPEAVLDRPVWLLKMRRP